MKYGERIVVGFVWLLVTTAVMAAFFGIGWAFARFLF